MPRLSFLGKPLAISATLLTAGTIGTAVINAKPIAQHSAQQSSATASYGRVSGPRVSGPHCRVSGQVGPHCDYALNNYIYAWTDSTGETYVSGQLVDSDPHPKRADVAVTVYFPDGFVATPRLSTYQGFPGYYFYLTEHKVLGAQQWALVASSGYDRQGAWSQSVYWIPVGDPRVSS